MEGDNEAAGLISSEANALGVLYIVVCRSVKRLIRRQESLRQRATTWHCGGRRLYSGGM